MSSLARRLSVGMALACLVTGVIATPARVVADTVPGGTIDVTTTSPLVANDGHCSIAEAIIAANTNAPGADTTGRCAAGSVDSEDQILFDFEGTITLAADLPAVTSDLLIYGEYTGPVTIDGADAYRPITVAAGATLELYSITLTNGASTGSGGAIHNDGLLLTGEVRVTSSTATTGGGGVATTAGSETYLIGTTVSGNTTAGSGGGILAGGNLWMRDSEVNGNTATDGGGGIEVDSADPVIVAYSLIAENTASGPTAAGGGIESATDLTVANATFAGNNAASGGAIGSTGPLTVVGATMTGNAAATGSAIHATGAPVVDNTIVLANTGSDPALDATLDGSSVGNLTTLPGGVTLGQVLDPNGLQANGGYAKTIALVKDASNPAWGGADLATCMEYPGEGIDQRGFERSDPCDIGAFEIDDKAPTLVSPKPSIRTGVGLDGSSIRGVVTWNAYDLGSGLTSIQLQVNRNGAGYKTLSVQPDAQSLNYTFVKGSSYVFRLRATDADGNVSGWSTGPTVGARLYQQTSSTFTFSSGWTSLSKSSFSSGSAKYTKTKGKAFKVTATGRVFSFITTTGPTRGKAKVYVDGTYVKTIDMYASSTHYRVQKYTKAFSTSGKHTIKIVVSGTSGRPRVDADAFAILK